MSEEAKIDPNAADLGTVEAFWPRDAARLAALAFAIVCRKALEDVEVLTCEKVLLFGEGMLDLVLPADLGGLIGIASAANLPLVVLSDFDGGFVTAFKGLPFTGSLPERSCRGRNRGYLRLCVPFCFLGRVLDRCNVEDVEKPSREFSAQVEPALDLPWSSMT